MAFTCPTCGQTYLQESAYTRHIQQHQQTHIDSWDLQEQEQGNQNQEQTYDISDMPVGLNRELFKVFEKFHVGDKTILCLWKNGHLSCAIRPVAREHELMDRLREWLEERG